MNRTSLLALVLALPLAAAAQTKPTPATTKTTTATAPQQVTEVTEDIDPATGKVIRRTTRTTTLPAGSTTTASPATPAPTTTAAADEAPVGPASDATVTDFFREKTVVSRLTAPQLLNAYSRFIQQVRDQRQGWKSTNWYTAATVLSSLNARYSQLRDSFSFDDKLTIRSQQAEFQALRTARQISDQVSDKL